MVASEKYKDCLNAFSYGYARFDVKMQGKKIFSILPFLFIPIFLILTILYILFRSRKKVEKIEEPHLECYLTKRNEGVLITEKEVHDTLSSTKEEVPIYLNIALDRQVVEQGETPNHIFFLLDEDDFDVITSDVIELLKGKNIWILIENCCNKKTKNYLSKIGKVILFDHKYMESCGYPKLVLGIIPRFLSLISKEGNTNLDHIYQSIPEISTFSYSFPIDLHTSSASVLKHQKFLLKTYGDDYYQVTNSKDIARYLPSPAKFVESETESFYVCFRCAL